MTELQVYTSRIWLKDPDTLNVTRGSGGDTGAPFAPSGPLLRAIKRGEISFGEYEPRYVAEMQISYGALYRQKCWAELNDLQREAWRNGVRPRPEAWKAELARSRRVYTCYEVASEECHRSLLAAIFVKLGAVYRGEIALPRRNGRGELALVRSAPLPHVFKRSQT